MKVIEVPLLPNNILARAERHVQESAELVARQMTIIEGLEKAGQSQKVEQARMVLGTLERSLELARDHLRIERRLHGDQ